TGRLAARWDAELARTSTIRISAPEGQMAAQSEAVLEVLRTTPGISSARVMSDAEQRKLLEPWFGPDLPLDTLPVPRLIEVLEEGRGPDAAGLKLRLAADAPGAVLDDHTRWRRPLVNAAMRLRILGVVSMLLIAGSTAAMITLAAQSALAANGQVISVLRLIGARDVYIARAFVRRFTLRALIGACVGTGLAIIGVLFMPAAAEEGAFLTGLGFKGWHWILPLLIPPLAACVAFWATRWAAFRTLSRLS
ncbi:MAG: cell division protein FtsX, partial [Amylibacter sp.]|nr:cell division protein FtsX [Amylibacter sp.]